MRILIIDKSPAWLDQGRRLLEAAGHEVDEYLVQDPCSLVRFCTIHGDPMLLGLHDKELTQRLKNVDAVIVDMELDEGTTSIQLMCAIKWEFEALPVTEALPMICLLYWTLQWEESRLLRYLGASKIPRPSRMNEDDFIAVLDNALAEQRMIIGGSNAIAIQATEDARQPPDERDSMAAERRANTCFEQMRQISEIAGLAEEDRVPRMDEDGAQETLGDIPRYWGLSWDEGKSTTHELGHAICDGVLIAAEIERYLPRLQQVAAKLRQHGSVDDRFEICAQFIEAGDLSQLELVRGCY